MKAFASKYPKASVWVTPGQYGPFGTCGVGASAGSCLAGQLMTCDCAQLARAEADAATSLDGPAAAGGIATCDTCGSCWCKY